MKPRALYHLMLIRARKLREEATPEVVALLDALTQSITTDHDKAHYTVGWTFDGTSYSLQVPDKDFTFYVAGDTAQAVEKRDNTRDYRQENWDRARQLWQEIGTRIGATLVPNSASDVMALQPPFADGAAVVDSKILAALALGAAVVTGVQLGAVEGIIALLTCALLFALWHCLSDTHLRAPLSTPFAAVLAAGAAVPSFFHATLWPAFIILFACTAACWVERGGRGAMPRHWFAAGVAASLPVATYGSVGAGVLLLLALGIIAAVLLVPVRYRAAFERWYLLGAVLGGVVFFFIDSAVPPFFFSAGLTGLQYALGALLVLVSALWWFHGTMSAFLAWWMLFVLGASCLLFAAAGIELPALLAFSGLALAGWYEVVRAYRISYSVERQIV